MPDEAKIRRIVQDEMRAQGNRDTYSVSSVPRHIHNGVDSPFAFTPTQIFAGHVPYFNDPDLLTIIPQGWIINHLAVIATFTGAFAGGETSGTLTTNWNQGNNTFFVLTIFFSNGDERTGTFTNGSTAVTWSGALSGAATATAVVESVGQYEIFHNLGTQQYTVVATASQSTNTVVVPVVTPALNSFAISWFESGTFTRTDTSFFFNLVQINNRNNIPVSYTVLNAS